MQFLKSVKEKTKSQSQIKHLRILLSRILAITALVLAFAQPYIPVDDSSQQAKKHAVSIYIDNSLHVTQGLQEVKEHIIKKTNENIFCHICEMLSDGFEPIKEKNSTPKFNIVDHISI